MALVASGLTLSASLVSAKLQPGGTPFRCSIGTTGNWTTWSGVDHTNAAFQGGYIDGVHGEVVVVDLKPCTNGSSGGTFVLAANLTGANVNQVAQLGYGKVSGGSLRWYYTPNADQVPAVVPGWPNPIVGHYYWLTIRADSQYPYFDYVMNDFTACGNPGCPLTVTGLRPFDQGYLAWWASETWNTSDVSGTGPQSATPAWLTALGARACVGTCYPHGASTPWGSDWFYFDAVYPLYRGPNPCGTPNQWPNCSFSVGGPPSGYQSDWGYHPNWPYSKGAIFFTQNRTSPDP
jgi:hypothetical protein